MNNQHQNGFSPICKRSELPNGRGKRFIVNDKEVAVFKIENEVYALCNICPHQHTALIYDGFIEDNFIVCPVHGWKFNLKTGNQPGGERGLDNFPVIIQDNEVYVRISRKN